MNNFPRRSFSVGKWLVSGQCRLERAAVRVKGVHRSRRCERNDRNNDRRTIAANSGRERQVPSFLSLSLSFPSMFASLSGGGPLAPSAIRSRDPRRTREAHARVQRATKRSFLMRSTCPPLSCSAFLWPPRESRKTAFHSRDFPFFSSSQPRISRAYFFTDRSSRTPRSQSFI